MITIVEAPNPDSRPDALSDWFGIQLPSRTCSMLGFGGWGVTKNQIAEAKFNQVFATSSGFSSSTLASPSIALEKAP